MCEVRSSKHSLVKVTRVQVLSLVDELGTPRVVVDVTPVRVNGMHE